MKRGIEERVDHADAWLPLRTTSMIGFIPTQLAI